MGAETKTKPTRTSIVLNQLRADIDAGIFGPGQRINEIGLASRYGVSRTPIREALLLLAAHGYVIREPHKGCRVADRRAAE